MDEQGFATRWASAPGDTITEVMRDRGLQVEVVASNVGLTEDEFVGLLEGRTAIGSRLANALSRCVGATEAFWLAREHQYREDLRRVEADVWSQQLPLKQMSEFGWIPKPEGWRERIRVSLDFFGVDDVRSWDQTYAAQVEDAHFRTSPTFEYEVEATAVWFRAGELCADRIPLSSAFEPGRFEAVLHGLRTLTRKADPVEFVPLLTEACAEVGVRVAVVRAPKGCTASGATRRYKGNPLILLSARHLSDDHFWFTFFHEAAHAILHDIDRPYIDKDREQGDDTEREANRFASNVLVGPLNLSEGPKSYKDVIRVSNSLDVAPGIVVGQLQNAQLIGREQFNRLKRRFKWNGANLEKARRH